MHCPIECLRGFDTCQVKSWELHVLYPFEPLRRYPFLKLFIKVYDLPLFAGPSWTSAVHSFL